MDHKKISAKGGRSRSLRKVAAVRRNAKVATKARKATAMATRIADDLLRNGDNRVADRLVLELPGRRFDDAGGWSRRGLINRISELIECYQ